MSLVSTSPENLTSFKYPQPLYTFLQALKLLYPFTHSKQLLGQAHFQNGVLILPQMRVEDPVSMLGNYN